MRTPGVSLRSLPPTAGEAAWVSFDGRTVIPATVRSVHQEVQDGQTRTAATLTLDHDQEITVTITLQRPSLRFDAAADVGRSVPRDTLTIVLA